MKTYESITAAGRCIVDLDHVTAIFLQGKYIFVQMTHTKIQMAFVDEEKALNEYKIFASFWSGYESGKESGEEKCVIFPKEL